MAGIEESCVRHAERPRGQQKKSAFNCTFKVSRYVLKMTQLSSSRFKIICIHSWRPNGMNR